MAVTSPTSGSTPKSYRRYALIWLLMTLLFGVATALVWMFAKTPAAASHIENDPITQNVTAPVDITRTQKVEPLHELDADVQPIDFSAMVRDLREYPEEFKDKRYLLANKDKWTVQVMNVAENDVIVDYLASRDDRSKFAYFRYRDDNNQLRYMLTYGVMSSAQQASGTAKTMDFGLPSNVHVIPETFSRYVNSVDSYELSEPVVDLGANSSRKVKLKPTQREVPARSRPVASSSAGQSNESRQDDATSQESASAAASTQARNSIRQSNNTSDTLVVKEERTVAGDQDTSSDSRSSNRPAKAENTANIQTDRDDTDTTDVADTSASKPVSNQSAAANKRTDPPASVTADEDGAGQNADALKELIEKKSN